MRELAELITRFERACEKCTTLEEASDLLIELGRAAGLSGRSDPGVPMIQGAVVPAKVWAEYGPRFEALRDRITAKKSGFFREIQRQLEMRHVATLRLFFQASFHEIETEEPLEDMALLRQCDGVTDDTHLESVARFDDTPALRLPIRATIVWSPVKKELEMVMEIALAEQPSDREIANVSSQVSATLDRGWATNPGFDFPEALADYAFHFDPTPSHHEVVSKKR